MGVGLEQSAPTLSFTQKPQTILGTVEGDEEDLFVAGFEGRAALP